MLSITHVIVGLGNGGAEKTLEKIASHDKNNKHAIISLGDPGHYGPRLRAEGLHVHCMQLRWWNLARGVKLLRNLRCVREADIITAWMPHAIMLAPLYFPFGKGVKFCINLRASSYGNGLVDWFRKAFLRLWAVVFGSMVDGVIMPGRSTAEKYEKFRWSKEKLVILHNGYQAPAMPSEPVRSATKPEKTGGPLTIGMFARWHPQKGHPLLFETLHKLSQAGRDFRLILVGEGLNEDNKDLSRLLERYDLARLTEVIGGLPSLEEVTKRIELHVLPSSFGEAFPNVVAETMLGGVPNVVTNVGDAAHIVGNVGWVIEPNNVQALYETIDEAMKKRADLPSIGHFASKRILTNFPLSKMVNGYATYFHDLVFAENWNSDLSSKNLSGLKHTGLGNAHLDA